MKLLIIGNDSDVYYTLKPGLITAGFVVDTVEDEKEGLSMAQFNNYDLLLAHNVPDTSGDTFCRSLREQKNYIPIVFLTEQTELDRKVALLNAGADDCISKPFELEELIARIHALLRRPAAIREEELCVRDLTLSLHKQQVTVKNNQISLTRKEFLILAFLLRRKGNIVSKVTILDYVWDSEVDLFSNAIETHVLNLRKKLNAKNKTAYIKTISGRGYIIS